VGSKVRREERVVEGKVSWRHEERRMRNEPSLAPFIRTSADVLDYLPVWQNSNGSRSIFAGAVDKQSCLLDGSCYQRTRILC
jgi:hypothetical protein